MLLLLPGTSNLYLLPGSHKALAPPGEIYPIIYDDSTTTTGGVKDGALDVPIGAVELVGR